MNLLCVIADIVDSRGIADRRAFQRGLEACLADRNARSGAHLASPYTITLGDEFQAVYRDSGSLFADVAAILWAVHPAGVRFSAAYGPLSTDVNEREALGMDGPAFHAARDALEALKPRKRTVIALAGPGLPCAGLVNKALLLFSNQAADWNGTSLCAFAGLMNGWSVDEVAAAVGLKRRTVYKAMASNGLRECADFLEALSAELAGMEASA